MGVNVNTSASPLKPIVQVVGNESAFGVIPVDGTAQTVVPTVPFDNASVVNCSECWLRVTVTPTDPASFVGDTTLIVPPGGNTAWGYEGDELQITSIAVDAVEIPAVSTAGADLVAKTALVVPANFAVNFVNQ